MKLYLLNDDDTATTLCEVYSRDGISRIVISFGRGKDGLLHENKEKIIELIHPEFIFGDGLQGSIYLTGFERHEIDEGPAPITGRVCKPPFYILRRFEFRTSPISKKKKRR
jgi:hypothetical protein